MRKHGLLFGAACIVVSSASWSFNPVQGWYAGGIGLVSYAPALNFVVTNPISGLKTSGQLDYRVGGGGGGQVGYRCAPWRIEGEIIFNINSYSRLTIGNTTIKRLNNSSSATTNTFSLRGDTYYIGGMVNGYYDLYQIQFSRDSQIVPFVGLGGGYVSVNNELRFYYNGVQVTQTFKESSTEGAFQVIVGAQYFADDFTSVGLDYRYFTTLGKIGNTGNTRFYVHTGNLTLNFAFDSTDN